MSTTSSTLNFLPPPSVTPPSILELESPDASKKRPITTDYLIPNNGRKEKKNTRRHVVSMSSPLSSSFSFSVLSPDKRFAAPDDERFNILLETSKFQTLQSKKFMTVYEAFQTIISTPTE